MPTLVLTTLLGGVAGCSSFLFRHGVLNYAQVQSVDRGLTADQIRMQFGEPTDVMGDADGEEGKLRELRYAAEDPDGRVQQLRIYLDEGGRVMNWTLGPEDRAD